MSARHAQLELDGGSMTLNDDDMQTTGSEGLGAVGVTGDGGADGGAGDGPLDGGADPRGTDGGADGGATEEGTDGGADGGADSGAGTS
jgi:hypothetical protein